MNFAITGVAGFVAPRHLRAIRDTGNTLIAAVDPHDSVGILDSYSRDVAFFTEYERFDRHLEKLRRRAERVHWLSVCSPNHLHDAHVRTALRVGADVICEKPLVLNPWNLDALQELEAETGQRVFTVLQLRVHPALVALRAQLAAATKRHEVNLTYTTSRGPWYRYSWKGDAGKSGGVVTNIGIHFFDLLLWLFGPVQQSTGGARDSMSAGGTLVLERADVNWFLSTGASSTHRSITVDGVEVEFSDGFTDLHTRLYAETLAGRGFGIDDARPAIELVHRLRLP